MLGRFRDWAMIKPVLFVATTALFVVIIEQVRLSGTIVPIPFLLLYASVVVSGGAAGKLAGGLSGAVAGAYVVYAAMVGFGPRTLTGGEIQVLLGVLLYVGTGLLLGRVRAQRDQFLQETRRHQAELESEILARTADLRKNEAALKSSEEMFRQMAENISEVFWMTDPAKNEMIYISPAYEQIWRRPRQGLYQNPRSFVEAIHPEDRERVVSAFEKQERGDYDEVYRIVRPDGTVRHIRDRAFPVRNKDGDIYRVVGIADDITEARSRDEQLRQAQKMEAVGQLTGGVAHDFNNILTVVIGNLDLLQKKQEDPVLKRMAQHALDASTRGADLTQRLLAIARKQTLSPKVLDLNECVTGMMQLMRTTLGETIDIEVKTDSGLWRCKVDSGRFENALLNLAINARDAMPKGGKLTIETRNAVLGNDFVAAHPGVSKGDYVSVSVSDTGTGIRQEILDRIFEPFFTTKDVGEGSGLGLSMVYGFIKQSGGELEVESEEGKGTLMRLYLPRSAEADVPMEQPANEEVPHASGEKILLVEDQADVRAITVTMLHELGYRVVEASRGDEALDIMQSTAEFDLLLSDLVLPGGMSGVDVANRSRRIDPAIKVLFITGYADDAVMPRGEVGAEFDLLRKPFNTAALGRKLRSVLGKLVA